MLHRWIARQRMAADEEGQTFDQHAVPADLIFDFGRAWPEADFRDVGDGRDAAVERGLIDSLRRMAQSLAKHAQECQGERVLAERGLSRMTPTSPKICPACRWASGTAPSPAARLTATEPDAMI